MRKIFAVFSISSAFASNRPCNIWTAPGPSQHRRTRHDFAYLAALWAVQKRTDQAWTLLEPLIERSTEGRETADIKSAEHLLASLA
jgi:hypothetical protein